MKLRYMIEHALRDRIRDPRYEPVGVWVQGSGPGLDLVIEFLPGNTDAREEADWIINAWWKTTSGLCPRIFWPTIRPRSQLTEACAPHHRNRRILFDRRLRAAPPGQDRIRPNLLTPSDTFRRAPVDITATGLSARPAGCDPRTERAPHRHKPDCRDMTGEPNGAIRNRP